MNQVYWGDSHCNIVGFHFNEKRKNFLDTLDKAFEAASAHLDFFPVAYYPFFRYLKNGLELESSGHHPQFDDEWETVRAAVKEWNSPGKFITFLGYEWHGDRETYGDHNVFYYEDGPLLATADLPGLYGKIKDHNGIVIPHHTAYQVGMRGKDWRYFDEALSPFAEIYSNHGSSEGCGTPVKMERNTMMGPRTSGGSIQDGLVCGYHFGFVGSSDNHENFAGAWNSGLMGVAAKELTKPALWDAFKNRRVYAVTGDRIQIEYTINDAHMGSIIEETDGKNERERNLFVDVTGCDEIDRIEVVKNNAVVHTFCHKDCFERSPGGKRIRFKQRVTMGWGPKDFGPQAKQWNGTLRVNGGTIISVEPCFTAPKQAYSIESDTKCSWTLHSKRAGLDSPFTLVPFSNQALIFEIEADSNAQLFYDISGHPVKLSVQDIFRDSTIVALTNEVEKLIKSEFGLNRDEIDHESRYWLSAYKAKIHRAVPSAGYQATVRWCDPRSNCTDKKRPEDFYYVRIIQSNGQAAWTSPVWIKNR